MKKTAQKTKTRPLTGKQVAWLNDYLINGFNATEAAKNAGYKGGYRQLQVQGSYNLSNHIIKAELVRIQAETSVETGVTIATQQELHKRLMKAAEDKGDLATATRNAELIGRTVGIYMDKLAISPDKGYMPPDELERGLAISRARTDSYTHSTAIVIDVAEQRTGNDPTLRHDNEDI